MIIKYIPLITLFLFCGSLICLIIAGISTSNIEDAEPKSLRKTSILFNILLIAAMLCFISAIVFVCNFRYKKFTYNDYHVEKLAEDKNATIIESEEVTDKTESYLDHYEFFGHECWIYYIPKTYDMNICSSDEYDDYRK